MTVCQYRFYTGIKNYFCFLGFCDIFDTRYRIDLFMFFVLMIPDSVGVFRGFEEILSYLCFCPDDSGPL
jgi:hypothetical protein